MWRPKSASRQSWLVITAAGAMLLAAIGLRAQGGGGAARPVVPAAASSIVTYPDRYIGENVSLVASIESKLSATAFLVDQDKTKAAERPLLVIAPSLSAELPAAGTYVTIIGDVLRFDPAEIGTRARGYRLDLPAETIERFRGQPMVLATAVIDPALTDLAKRVPPPMTPAEEALDRAMKAVQPASTAMRAAIEASDAAQIKAQTAILKTSFTEAQKFFQQRNTADAQGWSSDALTLVGAIEIAAADAKWDDARTSAGRLTQLCTQCHNAHRERFDDGTFRVRSGG
jgi:hypothetical protein